MFCRCTSHIRSCQHTSQQPGTCQGTSLTCVQLSETALHSSLRQMATALTGKLRLCPASRGTNIQPTCFLEAVSVFSHLLKSAVSLFDWDHRHDAVFRINVIGSGALSATPSQRASAPEKDPKYTGRRTTFRVFSRLVTDWLASGAVTIK